MKYVREDGMILEARNDIQASAFLHCGMKPLEKNQGQKTATTEKSAESTEKPKRGRKPKEA